MMFLEGAFVIGVLGLVAYWTLMLLERTRQPTRPVSTGRWRVTHYDVDGATRVVVQKVSAGGANLLDEHVVDTIAVDDPGYEERFLASMMTSNDRRALFEAEES
jgi:hypothetical protein